MKDLEDRLREALRAAAETVDETRSRPLPELGAGAVRSRWWEAHRRLTPVLAAAAVVLLVGGVVSVRELLHGGGRRPVQQAGSAMPRFFVTSVLAGGGQRSRLEIRDSGTGRVLDAEPAAPGVDYREVAAAADNRTFFAISEPRTGGRCRIVIDRLSVSEAGIITQRDPVVGAKVPGTVRDSGSLAVSPNGKMLSYGAGGCSAEARAGGGDGIFGVIDTGTGQRWEWPDSGGGTYRGMSWSGDGRYLFFVRAVMRNKGRQEVIERQELRRLEVTGRVRGEVKEASTLIRGVDAPRRFAGTAAGRDGREVTISESGREAEDAWSGVPGREAAGEAASARPWAESTLRADAWASTSLLGDLLRISVADGRVLRASTQRGTATFDHPLLKGDVSGRFLLTDLGALDTAGGGTAHPIAGLAHVFDADW
ncbi:hypothetical protein [Actinomadura roseirufa]|uniref:hypothetical protein n=1 Tax=Actinomadura roseirufa TaxID=2094049 RepID=UPI00104138F7|nr:hypothetical protein [Actinomadura roseirufa]